jgi:hypothetical protein
MIFTAVGLHRMLARYVECYERSRTNLALDKDTPVPRPTAQSGKMIKPDEAK